jgi:hypothetical protein
MFELKKDSSSAPKFPMWDFAQHCQKNLSGSIALAKGSKAKLPVKVLSAGGRLHV